MSVTCQHARRRPPVRRAVRSLLCLVALATAASCGGEDPPTGPGDPTISLALNPSSGTIVQGGSLTVTGSATLGGSFTGGVTFVVTGLPAGVTFTVDAPTTSGNTVTADLTVIVAASVAPGTYAGTISASGSGVSDAIPYSLTVTAAVTGGFSLGSVSSASIQQGGSATRTVDITRTGGFTGDVTLAVEGAPTGVTATPDPTTTGGASSTITIDVGGATAIGTTTLTVRGTAAGLTDATTTFQLTVTAPPASTDITFDYSGCDAFDQPAWFAYQDGAGTWTRVTGVGHVYEFSVSGPTFGIALVDDEPGMTNVSVAHFGVEYVEDGLVDACPPIVAKTVGGTVAGTVGLTNLSLGGSGTLLFADGAFQISAVPDGAQDLVGFSINNGAGSDRMLIERDLDIANNGTLGTVSFATDGFDPASATITLTGLVGGESVFGGMEYATSSAGSVCAVSTLHADVLLGSTFTARSAPASEQASDEFHVASVTVGTDTQAKTLRESFETLANRTVALPADLPTPTFTDVTGGAGYLRLQAEYQLPAEYNRVTYFSYSVDTWGMSVQTVGAAFSTDASLAVPDLSAVDGWDDAWAAPPSATGVEWGIGATGLTSLTPLCTDGGRRVTAGTTGTYN